MSDRFRIIAAEKELEELRAEIKRVANVHEDLITAVAALYEMLRRIDYDIKGKRFYNKPLGTYSALVESDEPQKIPLNLSVTKLDNNEIRIDFLSDDGDDEKYN